MTNPLISVSSSTCGRELSTPLLRPGRVAAGQSGIALLLVLIIFVVLYLVVYQLHFSTKMEEQIARARYGEVESSLALSSVAFYVMTLLVEDLTGDLQTAGMEAGTGATGRPGVSRIGDAPDSMAALPGVDPMAAAAAGMTMPGTGAAPGGWYDYLRENMFLPNLQQVGTTDVKVTIRDAESGFDLNRLFGYARPPGEDDPQGVVEDFRGEDLTEGDQGGDADEPGAGSLRDRILKRGRERFATGRNSSASADLDGEEAAGTNDGRGIRRVGDDPLAEAVAAEADIYTPEEPLMELLPSQVRATEEMLRRAIVMMFSLNENNGFVYSRKYFSDNIALSIVDYVMERRSELFNNRIHSVKELLTLEAITPEVFYGPLPELLDDEEYFVEGFSLQRDEFGDVVANYLDGDLDAAFLEDQRAELEGLMDGFGSFIDIPQSMGFDRLLSSGLTRGMTDWPTDVDEYGEEFVVEPPLPIGLRDLFCTFSTGKINLNTASVPVIFGLLLSLDDEEANTVTLDIRDYRNRFTQDEDAEDVDSVVEDQDPAAADAALSGALESAGVGSLDELMKSELGGSSYSDMETNYFKSLDQLELIDGQEGGPEDLLRRDEEVERVSVEDGSAFRRVRRDLEQTVVFGSTYFNVEMKAKTQNSRAIKIGYLTVKRDMQKRIMDVVMWKEAQR